MTTYVLRSRSLPCWCAARSPQGLTSFSTGTRSRCPRWSVRARVRSLKHASWRSRSSPCSKPSTRSRGDYKPYLGTVVAPAGASADAAAVAAAYTVLKNYFPLAPNLDAAYAASLAAIPDGSAKSGGIATGQAAAAQMIALRLNDGSSPAAVLRCPRRPTPACGSSRQVALPPAESLFSGKT